MKNIPSTNQGKLCDHGPEPFVLNLACATNINQNFRTALWTGEHMQLTLMCIPACGDIGLEFHRDVDQFICIKRGRAKVLMGTCPNNLQIHSCANEDYAIFIPAGTWHNIVNVGSCPLKLYSIYAPPQHPRGTIHATKEAAEKSGH